MSRKRKNDKDIDKLAEENNKRINSKFCKKCNSGVYREYEPLRKWMKCPICAHTIPFIKT